ncbi:hypothetical protein FUT69_00900 [Xylella taiwanensis]|uniref:Uncharacterized protein n=1 Tax=Xylella taiwanensis TaxID=1444770 RepID=Z9JL68_9GAMM|nr:hypothetical protein [Xylella taiwanensis]AXI83096.1 hypothetical protein AB672_03595 [Xylella taiwanensis]EWS78738.1 hypothetical protein AF72_03995 [Xylella taiwanensis]MCD8456137.1 hypothetical protein [Xylella taiwanensis]MCD8458543.1 hypothetical protein [Xylella taiwanensis]MCD8460678.1 hypothetical protein [Xylella taiwanensis]
MIVAFNNFIKLYLPVCGRFFVKLFGFISFILVFLYSSDIDLSSLDIGGAAILAVALSACLLLTNHYFDIHFHDDGSLEEKKDASDEVTR